MKPIWNKEAEQALIAACMLEPRQLDLLDIEPNHFRDIDHQKIWKAMQSIPNPDAITVAAKSGVSPTKIGEIISGDVEFWNIKEYAEIVKDMATKRQVAALAGDIITDAYKGELDIAGYIGRMDKLTTVNNAGKSIAKVMSDTTDDVLERIAQKARGEKVEIGYQTGIKWIDDAFRGLKRGWLVYWAGRPGVGKTKTVAQIAKVFAKQGAGSYVLLEGSEEMMAYRLLEGELGVDATEIEFGNVDATRLLKALEEFETLDYDLFFAPRLSVTELRAYIAKQKAERNIGWVIIDYVSLLEASGNDNNEKDKNMSAELRRICGEFNVLIIGLDSINKGGASKILSMEDISGMFSKQHDSDITFGYSMYRPVSGIAPEIEDKDRERKCRLLGVLKDRYRGNVGRLAALEMKDGLVNNMDTVVKYVVEDWSK